MSTTLRAGAGRALAVVAVLVASLAFAACGDDEGSGGSSADAGTKSGLGTERYKQLEAVYVAGLPLDELDDDAPPSEATEAFEQVVGECDKLDREDALLASYRPFCPLLAKLAEQFTRIEECEEPDGIDACNDAVGSIRGVFRDVLRLGPPADRAAERAKLTPACVKTLVTSELQYEVIRDFGRGFAYLQRALKNGSLADSEMAEEILEKTEERAEKLPDAKQLLADFRVGCA